MSRLHSIGEILPWIFVFIVVAQAGSLLQSSSFGTGRRLSSDGSTIPGWYMTGEDFEPEVLSDRVILTPPFPGSKRGAIWAEEPITQIEWTADFSFRANGEERAGGNIQLWYVKDGKTTVGTSSLYTTGPFDGLVIAIDSHGGKGGSVRGFLNDGKTDYRNHAGVDSLAFGRCDYSYRNLGRPSNIQVKQTGAGFEVLVDGANCFRTGRVVIPPDNVFGITAASAETPDSFETFKFTVNVPDTPTPDDNNANPVARGYQSQHRPNPAGNNPSEKSVDLSGIESQLKSLEGRLDEITTLTNKLLDKVLVSSTMTDDRLKELARSSAQKDSVTSIDQRIARIENMMSGLQKDVNRKDYLGHFNKLQEAVQHSHSGLLEHLQDSSHRILSSSPRMGLFIFLVVALQLGLAGSYIFYKKRRSSMPKKFL